MFTPATIKAIQDIMRQDIGVDGDATRLSQMVWLIYLKILDDEDKALEIRKEKFVPTLPKKYQWRTWAGPLDGMTGDKLIEFVNNDLLPGLRELPESGNKRTELTRMAFQDVYNFMRKGTLLKQVINKVNEIDFNASKDRHAFNEIYERLLKSLQSAGNFGEMYTPRAVTQFIVEMVDPKVGESVLDPAVGTGGFLVHALEHMRKQVKSVKDEQRIQQSIHGVEKKPLPFMLLITNMMLHGIEEPVTMRRGNTLEKPIRDYTDTDKVTCIVTNPPFGGTEEPGIESNFPKEFQTRETADLFLVLIMRLLKKNGRAGLVLPDGTLFGEGMKTGLKKALLEECDLHTIVRLPKSVFAPYTSIATNLLFFTKGEPTKEVWYYEHPFPDGQKAYSMTNPIRVEEFEVEEKWWNNREENDHAWKVSIDEIVKRNYNLDIKNPRTPVDVLESPEMLLTTYRTKQKEVKEVLAQIRAVITDALSHHDPK
ncbi:MAG: N-6 DNA methylase [Patescibacteria group bacterium]